MFAFKVQIGDKFVKDSVHVRPGQEHWAMTPLFGNGMTFYRKWEPYWSGRKDALMIPVDAMKGE